MSHREMRGSLFLIGFMGAARGAVSAAFNGALRDGTAGDGSGDREKRGNDDSANIRDPGRRIFSPAETAILRELQGRSGVAVSCGGGAAMRDENVALMRETGKIVLLRAKPETVLERVAGDDGRPLLRGRKTAEGIRELMEQRSPRYEAAADLAVDTDGKSVDEICREILSRVLETAEI